ncbi:MAG TPA: glycosyltransferase family 39 protein [Solirubrobacteraceae bacterium]|nr:glycosyltransferase family 39 protein [Solirubrobacteraceae bacterium]
MATYASRPAWELRARAVSSARIAAPLGIGALLAVSVLLRTRELGAGFWIDEGLSVGIADRALGDIPGVLRQDGSPPLYYVLLHFWLALAGRSEESVHGLSVLFASLCVPVAFWAGWTLFGRRTAWIAALLTAVNPFITQYAQEGRMYALVALLGMVSMTCWLQAFTTDADGLRTAPAIGFAVAFASMLYTHNWALFFGAASGVAWLYLLWRARGAQRRRLLQTGLLAYGGAVLLYAPWLPNALYQAAHTGAPWSKAPSLAALASVPARILGEVAEVAVFLAAGSGVVALLKQGGARGRAVVALLLIAVLTIVLAWVGSQLSPAWANRYLAAGAAPFLFLAAAGFARAGRLGLVGLALVAVLWALDGAPTEKSNVRAVAESIAPSLQPGDLVVATQPEQVPVLDYYLPDGLRYATLTGPVPDTGVADWRDGVERLRATSAERDLAPLLDSLEPGRRVALVVPQVYALGRWSAPWTELVRLRSEEWLQHVSNDPRLGLTAVEPADPFPASPNPVRAQVYLRR